MATFNEPILKEVKATLGIANDVTVFDRELKIHINSAFGTLSQLGLGPEGGFEIETGTEIWNDFLAGDLYMSSVKSYVYLSVKMLFDPPANSWVTVANKEQLDRLEWRLNLAREDEIAVSPPPLPDEELQYELDGGVI